MNIDGFDNSSCSERANIMNIRQYNRNVPSQLLQPYLDARPVSTKYSIMPIVDPRKPINVPLEQMPVYNPEIVFNPGNDTAPWSGYASNVNIESMLHNQIYALQKCSQSVYVPSSKSDLYNVQWRSESVIQPFPDLFKNGQFNDFNPNPNPNKIGFGLFNNATRQQIKDLTKETVCK